MQQHGPRLRGVRRIGRAPQLMKAVVAHRMRHLPMRTHKDSMLCPARHRRHLLLERHLSGYVRVSGDRTSVHRAAHAQRTHPRGHQSVCRVALPQLAVLVGAPRPHTTITRQGHTEASKVQTTRRHHLEDLLKLNTHGFRVYLQRSRAQLSVPAPPTRTQRRLVCAIRRRPSQPPPHHHCSGRKHCNCHELAAMRRRRRHRKTPKRGEQRNAAGKLCGTATISTLVLAPTPDTRPPRPSAGVWIWNETLRVELSDATQATIKYVVACHTHTCTHIVFNNGVLQSRRRRCHRPARPCPACTASKDCPHHRHH